MPEMEYNSNAYSVKRLAGRNLSVMSRGSELIREQLIRRVEEHLSEAVKAAQTAGLSAEELHQLLNL